MRNLFGHEVLFNRGDVMFLFNYDVPFISKLSRLQRMEVTYRSTGCFHRSSYLFDFDSKKSVVIYDCSLEKKLLGRYNLLDEELKRLDSLIQYYDNHMINYGSCTTIDLISIKIKVFNIVIRKFSYEDDSCMVNQQKDLMSFDSLLSKMKICK